MAVIPITPSTLTYRRTPSAPSSGTLTADRVVSWSVNGGATANIPSGPSTTILAPNKTQVLTVTATSGLDLGTATVNVFATFPVQPHYGYPVSYDTNTKVSYAEDGTPVFRAKGPTRIIWQLTFKKMPSSEFYLVRDFWLHHQKHISFYYEDIAVTEKVGGIEIPTLRLVTFDSPLNIVADGPDAYTGSLVIRES